MIKKARLNYRNTVTRIESDCTFRIGFSSLMNRTFFRRSLSLEKYVQEEDDLRARSSTVVNRLRL